MIHKNENFPFPRHFVNQDIPSATLISSAEVSGRKKGDPLRDGRYANRKSTRIPLERLNYPAMLSADKAPQGYKGLGPPEISGKVVDQPHPSGGSDVTAPAGVPPKPLMLLVVHALNNPRTVLLFMRSHYKVFTGNPNKDAGT
ncbi:hypothetical protein CEXT_313151 [Caerostris extrusa]|uniref:Uncharacterized protein n=1 Tax=Caerostris extrusa TaxID=172846 RepID=A0AAV4MBJ6_CAEEX|nr:hypothetical protein CEXT_313151 [Caerostris extrusa]